MAFNIFCRAALEGKTVQVFGDGLQTRDFTFVTDVVQATRSSATAPATPGRVYNIGGGTQVSLVDALSTLGDLVDRPIDVVHLPREPGDVSDTSADIRRAKADLTYTPTTDLSKGLAAELEWMAASLEGVAG
jgi:UDP-glucose 4-epimerase